MVKICPAERRTRFACFWRQHFGDVPPLGYVLRACFRERWVRFHSLPESKRYPDNEAEMETVLARANTVASEVLGEGEPCWMVSCWPRSNHRRWKKEWARSVRDPYALQHGFRFEDLDDPDDKVIWSAYFAECEWSQGAYDTLLRRVADDEVRSVLWVSARTGKIFAPYDGGSDLILEGAKEVDGFKTRHSNWLSSERSGL